RDRERTGARRTRRGGPGRAPRASRGVRADPGRAGGAAPALRRAPPRPVPIQRRVELPRRRKGARDAPRERRTDPDSLPGPPRADPRAAAERLIRNAALGIPDRARGIGEARDLRAPGDCFPPAETMNPASHGVEQVENLDSDVSSSVPGHTP